MSARRIVTATTPHALEALCCAEIARVRDGDGLRPVVVVVPGNEVAMRLRRVLYHQHGVRAGVRLWTMRDLAGHLAERTLLAAGRTPLAPPADQLLLEQAIAPLAAEPGRPFAPGAHHPGFVLALQETLKDLDEAGLDSTTLPEAGAHADEVARLHRHYRALLHERGLFDTAALLAAACEAAVALPDGATELLLYGFYDLTGLQRRLVQHVGGKVDITCCVPICANDGAGEFGRELTTWLVNQGFAHAAPDAGAPAADPVTDLAHVRRWVFAQKPGPGRGDPDGSVTVASVPGGEHEAREVARQLLAWRRDGLDWSEMAVLYHGGGETGRLVCRVLGSVGVPLAGPEETAGLPLRTPEDPTLAETAPGRALLQLLGLAARGWKRGDVIDALGLAPLRACGGPAPTARWEAHGRDAGVVGGLPQWEQRLERYAADCERRAGQAELEDEPGRAAALHRAAGEARDCVRVVLEVAARLDELPAAGPPGRLAEAAVALLDAVVLPDAAAGAAAGDLAEVRDAVLALRRLGPVIESLERDRFETLLADTLAGARLRRARARHDGVFVGSLYSARGLPFRAAAVIGLNERRFPPPVREDPMLPDEQRWVWRKAHPECGLEIAERRPSEERMLFALALAAAGERCTLFVPRVDPATGRELVPSMFALQVLEALQGEAVSTVDAELPHVAWTALGALPAARRAQALDGAEFDVSVVETAVAQLDPAMLAAVAEAEDDAGAQPLRRALTAADQRFGAGGLTAWDGLLAAPDLLARLAPPADAAVPRSPSRLETFAKCPYRYFLQYELRCEAIEEPDETERISPLDRGSLVHEVLEELTQTERAQLPLDDDSLPGVLAAADTILDRRFGEFEAKGLTGAAVIGAADKARMRQAIHRYVRESLTDTEFLPIGEEVRFGFPAQERGAAGAAAPGSDEPLIVTLPNGQRLAFRGFIDRVDRSPDGTQLRVVDYKTGRPPSPARIPMGEALQLPVYARAAELAYPGATVTAAEYHGVNHDPRKAGPIGIAGAELEAAKAALLDVATLVGDQIGKGRFFAYPAEGACEWCDFQRVCGPGRFRVWDRKQGDPRAAEFLRMRLGTPQAEAEETA